MTERPISFKPWFIPAIADGRKTQTRRLAMEGRGEQRRLATARPSTEQSPHGREGDRLWVKEAIYLAHAPSEIRYRADDALVAMSRWPWKRPQLAAMYLPRALSRYTLEIAEVRVQRLDEIDDRDADAEGVETMDGILDEADICRLAKSFPACGYEDGRAWYAATWEHIHGSGSWERDRALARGSMVCSSSHERWCSESSTGHPACTLRTPAACTEMASSTR